MVIGITGGTGFVGSRLANALKDGSNNIKVLTRRVPEQTKMIPGIEYFEGDITSKSSMTQFLDGVEVLINCAAELRDESKMSSVNAECIDTIVGSESFGIVRWIQLSSVGVYGPLKDGCICEVPEKEWHPSNTYELTKAEGERKLRRLANARNFDFVIVRPSNVFGKGMPNKSLCELIKLLKMRLFIKLDSVNSKPIATYIDVDNLVDAIVACVWLDEARNQDFNISSNWPMKDFIRAICIELAVESPKIHIPAIFLLAVARICEIFGLKILTQSRVRALTATRVYDCSKARKILGWTARKDLASSVKDLVSWCGYEHCN